MHTIITYQEFFYRDAGIRRAHDLSARISAKEGREVCTNFLTRLAFAEHDCEDIETHEELLNLLVSQEKYGHKDQLLYMVRCGRVFLSRVGLLLSMAFLNQSGSSGEEIDGAAFVELQLICTDMCHRLDDNSMFYMVQWLNRENEQPHPVKEAARMHLLTDHICREEVVDEEKKVAISEFKFLLVPMILSTLEQFLPGNETSDKRVMSLRPDTELTPLFSKLFAGMTRMDLTRFPQLPYSENHGELWIALANLSDSLKREPLLLLNGNTYQPLDTPSLVRKMRSGLRWYMKELWNGDVSAAFSVHGSAVEEMLVSLINDGAGKNLHRLDRDPEFESEKKVEGYLTYCDCTISFEIKDGELKHSQLDPTGNGDWEEFKKKYALSNKGIGQHISTAVRLRQLNRLSDPYVPLIILDDDLLNRDFQYRLLLLWKNRSEWEELFPAYVFDDVTSYSICPVIVGQREAEHIATFFSEERPLRFFQEYLSQVPRMGRLLTFGRWLRLHYGFWGDHRLVRAAMDDFLAQMEFRQSGNESK